jgi:large subunit ribosomal protein L18
MRRERVRRKVSGSDLRPRLAVFRSLRHLYAQVISDQSRRVLAVASTLSPELRAELKGRHDVAAARAVGKAVAARCLAAGIKAVVFDRAGYRYHGRIKALAEAARETGLSF